MKNLFVLLLTLVSFCAFSQEAREKYQRIKIYTDYEGIKTLAKEGFDMDHGAIRPGVWFIGEFSENDVSRMQSLGFNIEILVPDLKQHFLDNIDSENVHDEKLLNNTCPGNTGPYFAVPASFNLGSMGGYFTYAEMLAHLDTMAALWPNLITIKQPVSPINSIEGNPVFYVKISDNPAMDESEPKVLYTALHHAREPISMSQMIFYMYYLLENYASDPMVQYIVENTQMYFVPCLNPDGYLYNEFTDPQGGGFWRKNRRDNGDGEFGVDLNRNYGYNWGFDNSGSSPNTFSQVYRGTSPFSEPETQAIRDFCLLHGFELTLNYHAFGNLLIYPWGYIASFPAPDSALFENFATELTRYNNYLAGTADQTVGYIVNGSSDDWMYGEQTLKPKSFAMTPECGSSSDGFWPVTSRIIPLCQENVWSNLNLALFALPYATVTDNSPTELPQTTGYISYVYNQFQADSASAFTVSLIPVSSWITSTGSAKIYSGLNSFQELTDSISFTLNSNTPNGTEIKFILQIDLGGFVFADTIIKIFGTGLPVFAHNCDDTSGWTTWMWEETNSTYATAPASITDSPFGPYFPNDYNEIELNNYISLVGVSAAKLKFWAKWEIEPDFDFVQVLAATASDPNTWVALCGKYTKLSQALNEPVFDGFQINWVEEEMDLSDFIGEQVKFKFLLISDNFVELDGYYFDDLKVVVHTIGTGENEIFFDNSFLYQNYPNPAAGFTTVAYNLPNGNSETASLKIINSVGMPVAEIKLKNQQDAIKINTELFSAGVYCYFISNNNYKSEIKKMVILNDR